jgi:hypothetical protein
MDLGPYQLLLHHVLFSDSCDASGEVFFAPIEQHPQKIADLGTGTGSWAIESKLHPAPPKQPAAGEFGGRLAVANQPY